MTSNVFDIKRFGKYLQSEVRNCISNFGVTLIIFAAMPLIGYFFFGIFKLTFLGEWGSLGQESRLTIFALNLMAMAMFLPTVCYGKVTDKKIGTQFLMVPVSVLEKTLSMILICCILIPVAVTAANVLLDFVICTLDKGCGAYLLDFSRYFEPIAAELNMMDFSEAVIAKNALKLLHPALLIDDYIGVILLFLLGAIYFKKRKVTKTILCLIGISIVLSLISAPLARNIIDSWLATQDGLTWIINNGALIDTINDTVVNLALCTGIFFRVKTLKH